MRESRERVEYPPHGVAGLFTVTPAAPVSY
jgi:hypothetical protein